MDLQGVALIGTYPPRQCGIGTFTQDLAEGLAASDRAPVVRVIAIDEPTAQERLYPEEVIFQIDADRPETYRRAAQLLNESSIQLAIVQHEYGIFGGEDGDNILAFASELSLPLAVTLHTVCE